MSVSKWFTLGFVFMSHSLRSRDAKFTGAFFFRSLWITTCATELVPQARFSAGSLLLCARDRVHMGKPRAHDPLTFNHFVIIGLISQLIISSPINQ